MAEYGGEGQKKFEDKVSIMHYNDKTGEYKVLAVNPMDDRKGTFVGIRIGKKGEQANRQTLALNKQEIAYLIMGLTKIFNQDLD